MDFNCNFVYGCSFDGLLVKADVSVVTVGN